MGRGKQPRLRGEQAEGAAGLRLHSVRCPFNCVPSPRASLSNAHVSKYLLFLSRSGCQGSGLRDQHGAVSRSEPRAGAGTPHPPPAPPGRAAAARGTQPVSGGCAAPRRPLGLGAGAGAGAARGGLRRGTSGAPGRRQPAGAGGSGGRPGCGAAGRAARAPFAAPGAAGRSRARQQRAARERAAGARREGPRGAGWGAASAGRPRAAAAGPRRAPGGGRRGAPEAPAEREPGLRWGERLGGAAGTAPCCAVPSRWGATAAPGRAGALRPSGVSGCRVRAAEERVSSGVFCRVWGSPAGSWERLCPPLAAGTRTRSAAVRAAEGLSRFCPVRESFLSSRTQSWTFRLCALLAEASFHLF